MGNRESRRQRRASRAAQDELPVPWQRIQGAIWLLGLAILFWQDWFWPGILVVLAISGLFQAGVQLYLGRQDEQKAQEKQVAQLADERAKWLPAVCPTCGGPLNVDNVHWTGTRTATCPYCNAHLKPAD